MTRGRHPTDRRALFGDVPERELAGFLAVADRFLAGLGATSADRSR